MEWFFSSIFHDYGKYFDTLDLQTVFVNAVETNFPFSPLCFALQQHMAPRVLKANGCVSKAINVNASILAGCKLSVPITRLYSMRNLKMLIEQVG